MQHASMLAFVLSLTTVTLVTFTGTPVDAAGRYKKEGKRCVWAPNDSGPNQCTPPSGRYKKTGDRCEWNAKDPGPDQCVPPKGRFKKDGGRCVWDANDSGTDQCRPGA